jgi:hypothetical protein
VTSRAYYSKPLSDFLAASNEAVLGELALSAPSSIEATQRDAWRGQITLLSKELIRYSGRGSIYFEYSIPRLGKRIDVVLIIDHVLFVIEFKVGESQFRKAAQEQVFDYALDLKNFHETSHQISIAPVLICTEARGSRLALAETERRDGLLFPILGAPSQLQDIVEETLSFCSGPAIDAVWWDKGRYQPTPTVVEAATALYAGHSVAEISRSDAGAINLTRTSDTLCDIISNSRKSSAKSICFVTGVPGAGKTLVGLNIATKHIDKESDLYSVFLSGNGPLVEVLREALARDKVRRSREDGARIRKGEALSEVKLFVQNVHHFRDECLVDSKRAPLEHVALFDEAQRAWTREQTAAFMRRRHHVANFAMSEPEFLISCLDRHRDWAVVVCLVGGGQEINTGEAGIVEWIAALANSFDHWNIYISPNLQDSEYGAGAVISTLRANPRVHFIEDLHLGVSMRSFRAENVSELVKKILDLDESAASRLAAAVKQKYPIRITRDISAAKRWLRGMARGSERYGIVVSSQAQRLKPYAIDVRPKVNPVTYFLSDRENVGSSNFLEDAATEFQVQGLELDWTCVVWDADLRYSNHSWDYRSFQGSKWNAIKKDERKAYLKNAYRVLLTRARQGMVIVVPAGDLDDPTRSPRYYDGTYDYLKRIGIPTL